MFLFQMVRVNLCVKNNVRYMRAVKTSELRRYAEVCKMSKIMKRVILKKFPFKEISYERKNGNGARREGQGLRTAE